MPKEQRENLVAHMVMVHQSVEHYSEQFAAKLRRFNYTTPKNYLDYINTYLNLLGKKDLENKNQQDRLNIGIEKIKEAEDAEKKRAASDESKGGSTSSGAIVGGSEQADVFSGFDPNEDEDVVFT